MADALSTSKKGGLTRGKAILIAVLAVVLMAILYIQFGSTGAKANSATADYHPPRSPAAPQPPAAAAVNPSAVTNDKSTPTGKEVAAVAIIDETRWKSPELSAVIAYDPFALPATFPQPAKGASDAKSAGPEGLIAEAAANDAKKLAEAVEKLRMQLKELEARGVHVIIRERDQYAAMIGDRMLHVGDEINGFTVTAIDPYGVHVERKKSP